MTSHYGEFTLAGHHFEASLPSNSGEPDVWTIVVSKDGAEVRRETVPLRYRPLFGPDASDVAALNERIEQIVVELELSE